jgi:hypothetical protein
MRVFRSGQRAVRAADFAGLVPASRGAHCRPLHPRLASLCFLGRKANADPEPISDLRWANLAAIARDRRQVYDRSIAGTAHRGAGSPEKHIGMFSFVTIINSWRNFRGGVAVI